MVRLPICLVGFALIFAVGTGGGTGFSPLLRSARAEGGGQGHHHGYGQGHHHGYGQGHHHGNGQGGAGEENGQGIPSSVGGPPPPNYEGSLRVDSSPVNLNDVFKNGDPTLRPSGLYEYLKQQLPPMTVGSEEIFPTSSSPNRMLFKVFARKVGTAPSPTFQFELNASITPCSKTSSSGVCVEVSSFGKDAMERYQNAVWLDASPGARLVTGIGSDFQTVGFIVLRNAGSADVTLSQNQVRVKIRDSSGPDVTVDLGRDVVIRGTPLGYCTVVASGRIGDDHGESCPSNGPCQPGTITYLQNGDHIVAAVPGGVAGAASAVDHTDWTVDSGVAPDATGKWPSVPVDHPVVLNAKVTLGNGQVLYCAGKYQALGVPLSVKAGFGGDCSWFQGFHNYYLTTPSPSDPTKLIPKQGGGWNNGAGLSYPGLVYPDGTPAVYAKTHGEVPAAGVLELGARNDGVPFYLGPKGETSAPAVSKRKWAALVIVATILGKDKKAAPSPIYFTAIQDTSVFPNIQLSPTGVSIPDDPNAQVAFMAYLAVSIPVNGFETRGNAGKEYWKFLPGDKPVLAMHTASCSEANSISYPVVHEKGNEVPTDLSSVTACILTKPMTLDNMQRGLGRLVLARHIPQYAGETYDARLTLLAKQGPCVPSDINKKVDCLLPSEGAPTSPFYAGSSDKPCQYLVPHTVTVTATGTACWYDGYGGAHCYNYPYSYTYTWYETRYHGNCTVAKIDGCEAQSALRFASYVQGQMNAAACFLVYDKRPYNLESSLIAPVGMHQGIAPLTASVGGSAPMQYTNYPDSLLPPNADYGGAKTGVGCVPCLLRGYAKRENVANVVADFDAPNQRQPLYSFTWSETFEECAPPATVKSAIFGSDVCAGVPDTNHLCGSNNVPASTTCPSGGSPITITRPDSHQGVPSQTMTFTSGGNNYVKMENVRFCPGSVQSTNTIVSASPLILDIEGKGIQISRASQYAVPFDIYGTGRKQRIDWPMNTSEIAFLVRPGKKGEVSSIRQLFGDYKAKNGFEALKKLDSNRDGFIDAKDKAYKELRLWFDRNRNGIAEQDELTKLVDSGVSQIVLKYTKPMVDGIEGKTLNGQYLNTTAKAYRNIEDQWFYIYGEDGKRVTSIKKGKGRK